VKLHTRGYNFEDVDWTELIQDHSVHSGVDIRNFVSSGYSYFTFWLFTKAECQCFL
jgi:hypothetical protein